MLAAKLDWSVYLVTLSTMMGGIGVAFGSVLGSKLILMNGNNNIARIFLWFNIIGFFVNGLKLILNTYTILIGRFLYGVCTGVLN